MEKVSRTEMNLLWAGVILSLVLLAHNNWLDAQVCQALAKEAEQWERDEPMMERLRQQDAQQEEARKHPWVNF
jgi:hypothetical protein